MKDEKILSSEELMEITAGFEVKLGNFSELIIASKYGIKPKKPSFPIDINPEPPIIALYAVYPTKELLD